MQDLKLYQIQKGFFDTLDILLESDGNQEDIDTYNEVIAFLKEELQKKSSFIFKNYKLKVKLRKKKLTDF